MRIIFELSGEHEKLPVSEIIACLEAEEIKFNLIEKPDRLLIISSEKFDFQKLKRRLALTFQIDKEIYNCTPKNVEEIIDNAKDLEIGKGNFCVRAKRIGKHFENLSTQTIEKRFGMHFINNKVKLQNPDIEVKVILSNKCHIGIKKAEIDRTSFENRKVQYRPFFSPISLHPKFARVLVNLSRVKKNQTLLDPFCGTGGILIEAALVGANVIGSDVQDKMVNGCKENLNHFGISNYEVFCSEIGMVKNQVERVDAIATDLPYGRASVLHGTIEDICEKAFFTFRGILKDDCYAAVVLHDEKYIEIGKKYLLLKEMYKTKAHRSLDRFFCVYKK